jgi:hypothetical protein
MRAWGRRSRGMVREGRAGGARPLALPGTDRSVLMARPIPLPPLEEQRLIVDILNRAASIAVETRPDLSQ